MKKLLFLLASLLIAGSVYAQSPINGWPYHQEHEEHFFSPDGQHMTSDYGYYGWKPFGPTVGYALYGSRYRKAVSNKNWGIFLCCVAAPASAVLIGYGINDGVFGWSIVGGALCGASLGFGIPLWKKGRRELDWMMDDYIKNFGPKPYSANLSAGPTQNGIGLAFNF